LSAAKPVDPILLEIVWSRLAAIVSEQATSIIRTSFSPLVRDAGDLATAVFDVEGRMIAHGVTGTAGHIVPMSQTLRHFLSVFPEKELRDGDVLINNDPWTGSGHLFDVTIATPVFHRGRLVAFVASTSHQLDIGGLGYGTRGADVFEEGLFIPPLKFARRGRLDEALMRIIRANVREPDIVLGDLQALAAANEAAGQRVKTLLAEYGLSDLQQMAQEIFERSEAAMRRAVLAVPDGVYRAVSTLDGEETPVEVAVTVTVAGDQVNVDFTGSSPQVRRGINVTPSYTAGFTIFALWCALGRGVPNNHGSLAPFEVTAPPGTIVSASYPAPVSARHVVGQMVPGIVLLALSQAVPESVIAEGAGAIWALVVQGVTAANKPYMRQLILAGGMGARPNADGLSTTQYPTGTRGTPIEITEAGSMLRYRRKELRIDSGGAGRYRGGLGQVVEFDILPDPQGKSCAVSMMGDRSLYPAAGLFGAAPGAKGRAESSLDGPLPTARFFRQIDGPLTLLLDTPGGGGYGPSLERPLEDVQRDIEHGYVSVASARRDYGVVCSDEGVLDFAASDALRRRLLGRDDGPVIRVAAA
jgi:N-methylhydantoinase B